MTLSYELIYLDHMFHPFFSGTLKVFHLKPESITGLLDTLDDCQLKAGSLILYFRTMSGEDQFKTGSDIGFCGTSVEDQLKTAFVTGLSGTLDEYHLKTGSWLLQFTGMLVDGH